MGLSAGSAWRCSFDGVIVGAEYHDDVERVSCFAPAALADASNASLNVSIDGGSSFCAGEPLVFRYYEQPNVSAISPASGSAQGGTRVTVSGSGFSGLGGAVVCTFGSLRVGDDIRAGATSPAASITDGQLECIAPSAHASSAVGSAFFSFSNLPPVTVIQPCVVNTNCIPGMLEPERLYRFPSGHNLTLFGGALNEAGQIKLTRNLYRYIGSMVLSLYYPSAAAGVPVRDFEASWLQEVGRGSGADGYSFVFGDLSKVNEAFGEMGYGDGLIVRFRTRGYVGNWNEGHGVIEAVYNGTLLNSTFMGDSLRTFHGNAVPVRVHKDPSGLSVYFNKASVLQVYIPDWAPQVGWAFGFGARTGDRKDDHWIDNLQVQSGYLLDLGAVEFGVSLNGGADVSRLSGRGGAGVSGAGGSSGTSVSGSGFYTYTSDPSVFSFSPTTGPEQGNTTVRVVGSHFAGGSDHRCVFGGDLARHNVPATYDGETRVLTCRSPAVPSAALLPLEVSLNNRPDSTSASNVGFNFYAHPVVADARGPYKHAAPAGASTNVSVHGANFSGGDDYRVTFSRGDTSAMVNATYVNDTLVLAVAPPTMTARTSVVALTLNGQQYTDPLAFPFFAVHSLSPSTGPTQGGTRVLVNGTAFDDGGAYRCNFGVGGGVSEASRVDDSTLACHSPMSTRAGPRPLEVSLNARDFSVSNISFGYYAEPRVAALPAAGPQDGGTLVAVRSRRVGGLGNGSHYLCRFGSSVVDATYVDAAPPPPPLRGPHNNLEVSGGTCHFERSDLAHPPVHPPLSLSLSFFSIHPSLTLSPPPSPVLLLLHVHSAAAAQLALAAPRALGDALKPRPPDASHVCGPRRGALLRAFQRHRRGGDGRARRQPRCGAQRPELPFH